MDRPVLEEHFPGCLAEYPLGCLGVECACPCHTPPIECRACRIQRCEMEGNVAELHTCVTRPDGEFDASGERETQTELEEHFPEPCAVGGYGPVWCAGCGKRWPCNAQ